jgi:hypothetical protein
MAVRTPCGKTFPGNFSIIPSSKKWVFHAIFRLAFLQLYGNDICSMNWLVLTDEEDAEYDHLNHSYPPMRYSSHQRLCFAYSMQYGNHLNKIFILYFHANQRRGNQSG